MSNKIYNTLKWVASTILPASVVALVALSGLIPEASEQLILAAGIVGVGETFLGTILGVKAIEYQKKIKQETTQTESYKLNK